MSLPFGLTPSTIKPGAVRNMTSDKLATFSLGGTKKTPFQKHKEALEAKRKKEEEQLAAEHAQWISDFEEPSGTKRFVKGDTINHGNVGGGSSGSGGGGRGSSQPPASKPPNAAVQSMFGQDDDIDGEDIDGEEIGKAASSSSSAPARPGAGAPRISAPVLRKPSASAAPTIHRKKETRPSQMAEFMNELRQEQARGVASVWQQHLPNACSKPAMSM